MYLYGMEIKIVLTEVLFILTGLILLLLIFMQVRGGLEDRRFNKWHKKIRRRGWIVIFLYFLIITMGVGIRRIQYLNEEYQQKARDSLITEGIQAGIDSKIKEANKSLLSNISDSLVRYGLKIDTLKGTIIKNGKQKTSRILVKEIEPFLEISALKEANDFESGKYFKLDIISKNAPSTNFNVRVRVWLEYLDGRYRGITFDLLPEESRMDKNYLVIRPLSLGNVDNLRMMHIHIKGSYTNLLGSNRYYLDEIIYKDFTGEKKGNRLTGQEKEKFKSFLDEQKFLKKEF